MHAAHALPRLGLSPPRRPPRRPACRPPGRSRGVHVPPPVRLSGFLSPTRRRCSAPAEAGGEGLDAPPAKVLYFAYAPSTTRSSARWGGPSPSACRWRAPGRAVWSRTGFDFGPGRAERERVWTPEVHDALIGILMALPTAYRRYVRRSLDPRVQEQARRGAITSADVGRLWADLKPTMRIE